MGMRLTKEILVYAVSFLLLAGAFSLWWQGVRPSGSGGLEATAPGEAGFPAKGPVSSNKGSGQGVSGPGSAGHESPGSASAGSEEPGYPGSENPGEENEGRGSDESQSTSKVIYVHVAGAVKKPGVYQLKEGQRVFEAVEMAQPKEDADLDALNLALYLRDQDKVYVPRKGESNSAIGWVGKNPGFRSSGNGGLGSSGGSSGSPGSFGGGSVGGSSGGSVGGGFGGGLTPQFPININTAGPQELDLLPGIGPSLAAAIINYRTEFGPFQNPEDITRVPGIGEKTFQKFSKLITTR